MSFYQTEHMISFSDARTSLCSYFERRYFHNRCHKIAISPWTDNTRLGDGYYYKLLLRYICTASVPFMNLICDQFKYALDSIFTPCSDIYDPHMLTKRCDIMCTRSPYLFISIHALRDIIHTNNSMSNIWSLPVFYELLIDEFSSNVPLPTIGYSHSIYGSVFYFKQEKSFIQYTDITDFYAYIRSNRMDSIIDFIPRHLNEITDRVRKIRTYMVENLHFKKSSPYYYYHLSIKSKPIMSLSQILNDHAFHRYILSTYDISPTYKVNAIIDLIKRTHHAMTIRLAVNKAKSCTSCQSISIILKKMRYGRAVILIPSCDMRLNFDNFIHISTDWFHTNMRFHDYRSLYYTDIPIITDQFSFVIESGEKILVYLQLGHPRNFSRRVSHLRMILTTDIVLFSHQELQINHPQVLLNIKLFIFLFNVIRSTFVS